MKRFKQEAWEFYKKWRHEETYCPALKSKIRISLIGWRHISGSTGSKKRTFKDSFRRMKLLPYAKEILQTSTTIQNITIKNGRTFYALEAMTIIKEDNFKSLRKIRVIVVEDKQQNKIFYSVMDKKQKN